MEIIGLNIDHRNKTSLNGKKMVEYTGHRKESINLKNNRTYPI